MIVPHYRPSFNRHEQAAVQAVIESQYIAQASKVQELEQLISEYVNKKYGVAVSSGTTALILALKALNIIKDDEIIIPSYTCTALWHAVKAAEGIPVLADIEPDFYNLDPEDVKRKINPNTKAVIFPHMFGQPGRITEILEFGIPVIEDIAQAIGATVDEKHVGSFGHLSVVSFYATKVIGAGEGGAILTNDESIVSYIKDIREYDEKNDLKPRVNAKMSDLTAAVAIEQFKKLEQFTRKRYSIFNMYKQVLEPYLNIPQNSKSSSLISNMYRCIVSHPHKSANELINIGAKYGVTLRRPIFRPIHRYLGIAKFPNTDSAWERQVSIPIFPDMKDDEIHFVISFLKNIYS